MKPRFGLFLLVAALFFSACNRRMIYRPAPVQPDPSDLIYTHGIPALRTSIQGCEVVAELSSRGERDMNLNLYIRNHSDSIFTFRPDQVLVHGYNSARQRVPFRVFGAEEYIRWKNTRDALIAAGVLVAAVATVIIVHETTGGSSAGGGESYRYAYSGADFVYDLTWWLAWTIPSVAAEPLPPPAYSPDLLLRDHTLYPGEAVQGIVKVRANPEYKRKILVEVPVNGAYAQFVFDRQQPYRR